MEKNVQISILCELYGKLLTEKQYIFLDDYYNNDLSLSEIAENNAITRQAVRDIINKAENKLFEYEEKLKLFDKMKIQEENIKEILQYIDKIENDIKDNEIILKLRIKLENLGLLFRLEDA